MKPRRLHLEVKGIVQGVGFRPFVYRLARELNLAGWVRNTSQGVQIEIEGQASSLEAFPAELVRRKPALAQIESIEQSWLERSGSEEFRIEPSSSCGEAQSVMLPDTAICEECLSELFDSANRRYLYPFITCTTCGPRYSIAEGVPFDRERTSMRLFKMCPECQAEYKDPLSRRFHSQTNSCAACGPRVELWDNAGRQQAACKEAISQAARSVEAGKIVALKGIGGFQLILDARNEAAVQTLRARKQRPEKPLAIMLGGIEEVVRLCHMSAEERASLMSAAAPIVLLRNKDNAAWLASNLAPGVCLSGVMLPCSPLHYLLLRELDFPIVATSGNISDEPICVEEKEALQRLLGIADLFLVHNRPVINGLDDSILRVMAGQAVMFRRARGYAPAAITIPGAEDKECVLGLGAHLKNTVALLKEGCVHLSQHLGTLESAKAYEAFKAQVVSLPKWYGAAPKKVVCDRHPDYFSSIYALESGYPVRRLQHHAAHIISCMAENGVFDPLLGAAFDGSGYGLDGSVWGGEFLLFSGAVQMKRAGHLRTFRLPGGERAVEEPRRSALGLLYERFGTGLFCGDCPASVMKWLKECFSLEELAILKQMLEKGLNSPVSSSVGRLFDAVSALCGLRQRCSFEGQAAMELEAAGLNGSGEEPYHMALNLEQKPFVLDWALMLDELLEDKARGESIPLMARRFHLGLAEGVLKAAIAAGQNQIVLSGGTFQNKLLLEQCVALLEKGGFRVVRHRSVPPNDGGIALGQAVAGGWGLENEKV